ncbi:unnamed protein product [Rhodiola kirilowii]
MGKGVKAGDESVEVMRGIEHGSEVNVVNGVEVVEVGSECDGKEDVHNDGVVTSGEDESDNSYVLVSGSEEMLEDAAERGDGGEVLVELSDPEVVEKYGSKEDEGEKLDGGPKTENEEDGKSSCVVESGVSLSSEDALERSVGKSIQDERKTSMVEEIEIVDKETEQGEVENTSKVEKPIEVEYLDKLDDVQEAVDVAPYDHESNSQQVSGGMVDSGVADLELSNSSSEGKLDSEIETTELNISEHSAELEKEGNEDSSLDVKENQECEDPLSSDAPVNSMELQPIEVRCLHNLEDVPETVIVAPYDRESDSQQNISGIMENRDADPEVSTPSSEEKLDSENETGESNESDLIAEELEKESNEESYLDEKVNQEYENLVQNDTRVNSMELELAEDIHVTDESLFDKRVTVDENPQLSEEENALDNKSAVSTDVKESITSEGLVPIDELDFNREEQNESVNILPVESNAAYEALHYEYDDVQSRKVIGAAGNGGSNIDSVPNSDEIGIPEAASAMPTEIIFKSTEQKVDCKTQMLVNDDLTPEAEQTMSKEILVNSFDQEQKESASDIDDGLHSDLRTKCSNGSSSNSIGHDLADDVEVVEFDTYTNDSGVRTDDEWPELSFYNTKNKINTESKKDEQGSQESENRVSDEIYLADPDRKEVQNVSPVIDNHAGLKKEVVDTSLSEDSEKAFPGSGTSEEIIHSAQSTTWADDNDQTYGVSSPSVLSTCSHSISDGVGSNEVAISESGNKNDETNSHENVEGPKVETVSSSDEASSLAALENEVDERPFFYLIKVPRFDDDDLREQNKFAQQEVDEKTKLRDSYKAPIQTKRDVCMEFNDDLETARLEEKVARDNLKAKRKEIEDAQAVLDKVNNAMTVEEIDGSIRTMEHRIQHETVPLSEEKQLIREIKRLKHFREQLSSSIGTQEELQEALDQKDQIKDHLKILKRDLNLIRSDVQRADTVTRAAKKKCFDKFAELNKLQLEFKAADGIRQEAYMCLVSLRRELARKNKLFWMYKDTEKAANDYALSGDRKALHSLCVNQVETVMDLWNTNNEFRKDYAKCNARSTLRRLKTLDGRSLGLDEEPPSIPFVRSDRIIHSEAVTNSFSQFPSLEESNMYAPYIAEKILKDPVVESVEKEAKKQSKSARAMSEVSTVPSQTVPSQELTQEAKEEVAKTKGEEELAKKTEENRKKEEEAKMMEQFQLEEKAKAKEALERKKRMAERAQARAKLRAKKEAEQREKEREKRLRRKEKRKDGNENDFIAVHEAHTEVTKETNAAEKHVTVTKRHHRPSDYAKATKTNTMPINLRNRNRRKMQMWVWIIVAALAAIGMVSLWFGLLSSVAEREQFSH